MYLTDWANLCEYGYYSSSIDPCKYAKRALKGMLNLGIRPKNNVQVDTDFYVNWNKNGFTRFTAHNGTIELLNDYLM